MHVQFNIPNNNLTYRHMNQKVNFYGTAQRKTSYPYRKFQTGSTTTFSGYTDISNHNNKKINSRPSNFNNNNNNLSKISTTIPSLMSLDCFQKPSRRNYRTIQHAEQYKNRSTMFPYHIIDDNKNVNHLSISKNKFNGLILSDSMCKYVRSNQVSSDNMQVSISFESGCDCSRMLNFLEQQQKIIQNKMIKETDFLIFSLCTNDVANLGPDNAIQNCRFLIERTRQIFPQLKTIGWLTLSPRWKPSKLFNSLDIDKNYKRFNQLLKNLSNEMNFEIINANLQHQHMHQDGLHPSITSGRILIERALHRWLFKQKNSFSLSTLDKDENNHLPTPKNYNVHLNQNKNHYNRTKIYHQINQQQQQQDTTNNYLSLKKPQFKRNNYRNNININNNDNNNDKCNNYTINQQIPSKTLINHYPHFLRHKAEFERKISIPTDLESKKEDIFILSNIHYQTEYFKVEAEK
ncbi:unnamed protein product [Rotaria sp. Silwood2]|nr:unnamed protein product [Rotaria sp. Silwood2]CAF3144280.1 unnamed protein product [Rotaria sp. Silwood2]CAF3443802.1 unnamed protein product [Rotaria sp. Silwood2]CAF4470887.1 unnamed protein product [Rotaria sp. Silwood2]CAF4481741.1 unnamed protein product [Rotaria sp. Silwood2]